MASWIYKLLGTSCNLTQNGLLDHLVALMTVRFWARSTERKVDSYGLLH